MIFKIDNITTISHNVKNRRQITDYMSFIRKILKVLEYYNKYTTARSQMIRQSAKGHTPFCKLINIRD